MLKTEKEAKYQKEAWKPYKQQDPGETNNEVYHYSLGNTYYLPISYYFTRLRVMNQLKRK